MEKQQNLGGPSRNARVQAPRQGGSSSSPSRPPCQKNITGVNGGRKKRPGNRTEGVAEGVGVKTVWGAGGKVRKIVMKFCTKKTFDCANLLKIDLGAGFGSKECDRLGALRESSGVRLVAYARPIRAG